MCQLGVAFCSKEILSGTHYLFRLLCRPLLSFAMFLSLFAMVSYYRVALQCWDYFFKSRSLVCIICIYYQVITHLLYSPLFCLTDLIMRRIQFSFGCRLFNVMYIIDFGTTHCFRCAVVFYSPSSADCPKCAIFSILTMAAELPTTSSPIEASGVFQLIRRPLSIE